MNLFKVFKEHQLSPEYRRRVELIEKLSGKPSLTEEEIKEVLKFTKIAQEVRNLDAYEITSKAFKEPTLAEKIKTLRRLHGVGMIAASAILAFQNPYKYAIINPNAVSLLQKHYGLPIVHKERRGEYNMDEYARYLDKVLAIAEEYGMKPFDIEFSLSVVKD